MDHLVLAVVEHPGLPGVVPAPAAGQEVLVVGAVQVVQALALVGTGVAVHHVQQHGDAQAVGLVDQVLQVLRRAVAVGGGEEVGHLVAEGGVVGVLLYGHQLDGVVAGVLDPVQGLVGEFPVGAHPGLLLGHADVGLVDHRGLGAAHAIVIPVGPLEGLVRLPDLAAEGHGALVQHAAGDPGGNALEGDALPAHHQLDELAVLQRVRALQRDLPDAVSDVCQRVVVGLPVVEVALQPDGVRAGQPVPEHPAGLGAMEAEIVMAVGEIDDAALPGQLPARVVVAVEVHPHLPGVRPEPRILLDQQPHGVVDVYHIVNHLCR